MDRKPTNLFIEIYPAAYERSDVVIRRRGHQEMLETIFTTNCLDKDVMKHIILFLAARNEAKITLDFNEKN